jgi:tetratricopeptide (TPR) repeat protein
MGNENNKMNNGKKVLTLSKETITSTTTSSALPLNETTSFKTSSLPDGVTIIWLDRRANSYLVDNSNTKIMLEEIHSSVFTFDDVKNCRDFLSSIDNEKSRVFLVVSGTFSTRILPDLNKLTVIDSIFIYCAHPEKYKHLVAEYFPYIIDVFSKPEALQLSLETELKYYHARSPALNFFAQKQSAIRDLTYDAASFLWFQLLQKVLMKTKYDANDMKQMLNYCRQHLARETQQQKFFFEIAEFERTYKSTDAINWYTRQSFVYKLINRALRTEDVEALYIFRFYISDLCRQLANEHNTFRIQNEKSPIIKLYRGCRMHREELKKLQDTKDDLTSMNGFVSTSREKWVANQFLLHNSRRRNDVENVLWIIETDTRMDDIIFAYVAPFSQHSEEEEVIFNIGSVFRIKKITLDEETNIWHVEATATNAGSRAVSEYMELIRNELNETSEKVIFGTLLMDMGKYVTAQRYFQDLIEHSDKNHPDLAAFYYNLGLTFSFQRDLHLAEQNFLQALDYQKMIKPSQRNVVRILNALGWVYQDNGELSKAINSYTEAESICEQKLESTDLANAQTYTYMGRYYLERQQYKESNTCYQRAFNILRLHLPDHHQRFGIILNEIGDLRRKQGNPEEALRLYQQAEAIFDAILPEHHPCMAYCWSSMGLVLLQLNDIEEARRYHKKALKSYKRILPPDHINISISEKNLKCISYNHIIDSYLQVCSQV